MEREVKFHADRKWRADFANLSRMVLVEIDGGNRMAKIGKDGKPYAIGRHTKEGDYRKLNCAALMGYHVIRFTPSMVKSGEAITMMLQVFKEESGG